MVTRSDYLSNIVSHREYYAQYVSPVSINLFEVLLQSNQSTTVR